MLQRHLTDSIWALMTPMNLWGIGCIVLDSLFVNLITRNGLPVTGCVKMNSADS